LERKFLEWQMKNGRAPLEAWAKYLELSQPYLSQLMSGKKKKTSLETAMKIARKTGDYSILDVCGYTEPEGVFIPSTLPADLRERLRRALEEISSTIKAMGIDPESDEAAALASEILARHELTTISIRREG